MISPSQMALSWKTYVHLLRLSLHLDFSKNLFMEQTPPDSVREVFFLYHQHPKTFSSDSVNYPQALMTRAFLSLSLFCLSEDLLN